MAANVTAIVVAFIGALTGLLGLYFSRKGQARSESADAVAKTFTAAHQLNVDLAAQLVRERQAHAEEFADMRERWSSCLDEVHALTKDLVELHTITTGRIHRAAAEVSEEDPHSPEAVERVREFVRNMKEIGHE